MKNAILIIFIFLCTQAFSQEVNCKKYRTGVFSMTDKEIGTTIITRTTNKQIEENKKLGTKRSFDVVWVDDCTYELRNKKR
ncbi:MAG: hypothetical protein ACXWW0_11965 [Bacteroidia bacterium]